MFQRELLSVYFVAGTQDCLHLSTETPEQKLLSTLETALQAGITCYQFREKGELALQDKQAQWQLTRDCQALCRQYGVPFVLNNDVEMAVKLGADGVHIGQKDMAALEAIKLIQGKLFLGISNSTLYELQNSLKLPDIDYWAVGAIFNTASKPDAMQNVGIDLIRQAKQLAPNKPLVAIGGISVDNVANIWAAGADGVAVISAITQSDNVMQTVQKLKTTY
ncbi:thiamine phosphate synthase [Glaesserella parasuis]|uniref:thiamine phosphate synthase n=1 Tax=Glaesserella parasuis TaxID=738 RepID=UPI002E9E3865|nr:thiamine phosphate synthase [Glaesserella parasuis]MEE3696747.1 thiamine phosphate synthase [Glaesserella parasuis]